MNDAERENNGETPHNTTDTSRRSSLGAPADSAIPADWTECEMRSNDGKFPPRLVDNLLTHTRGCMVRVRDGLIIVTKDSPKEAKFPFDEEAFRKRVHGILTQHPGSKAIFRTPEGAATEIESER